MCNWSCSIIFDTELDLPSLPLFHHISQNQPFFKTLPQSNSVCVMSTHFKFQESIQGEVLVKLWNKVINNSHIIITIVLCEIVRYTY